MITILIDYDEASGDDIVSKTASLIQKRLMTENFKGYGEIRDWSTMTEEARISMLSDVHDLNGLAHSCGNSINDDFISISETHLGLNCDNSPSQGA